MSEHEFWNLRHPESTARLAEWADGMDCESTVICPIEKGHQRAGKRLPTLRVALPSGAVQDFVWTWYSECLVQDRVVELFQANGFTGFDLKPVKARFKRVSERKPPQLRELTLTGWAGMAPAESGIRLVERCEGCGHTAYSGCSNPDKLIDASQWDGSDFFMVWPLPGFVFVTNRVAQVIREKQLTGVVLRRPKDLSFTSRGFSPGPLTHWMPEDRARELGGPLEID